MRAFEFRVYCSDSNSMEYFDLQALYGVNYYHGGCQKVILQFTGIFDSKNNKIFEGDILWAYDQAWKVVFSEGCFICTRIRGMKPLRTMHCEVIGNVYQHPNLMYKERK